ncbi:hypothetical protein ACWDZ8_21005 [Streptomyces sp. NPDC003233]
MKKRLMGTFAAAAVLAPALTLAGTGQAFAVGDPVTWKNNGNHKYLAHYSGRVRTIRVPRLRRLDAAGQGHRARPQGGFRRAGQHRDGHVRRGHALELIHSSSHVDTPGLVEAGGASSAATAQSADSTKDACTFPNPGAFASSR